jgi:peptidoglycan/LPS O-acetylase OafA/YrhL
LKTSGEIPILDNLRAVAAWSVCLYHFVCTTVGFVDTTGWIYRTFYFGQFGVHLFFIISGMVIPWSLYKNSYRIKNLFNFLLKRFVRLEPPYLFSILLAVAFILMRKYSPTFDGAAANITLRQVFLHLGYLVPFFENVSWLNNVYWTLAIEFQYYLVIGLLYFLFVSPKILVRMLGYLLLAGAPLILTKENLLPFWLPLFGVGIILFLYKSQQIKVAELLIVSLVFIAHLFIFNSVVAGIIAMGGELLILFMFSYSNSFLSFLGKFSYSVYLMHAILGAAFVNVLSHYIKGCFAKLALVLGGLIITGLSSYLMFLFVEKPSKKLSSKLSYQKSE